MIWIDDILRCDKCRRKLGDPDAYVKQNEDVLYWQCPFCGHVIIIIDEPAPEGAGEETR